ncbi:hypothetical protein ACDN41_12190 [Priestia aryabhattai]|uniref:hypothetical protein n=1 Tax=Priestia aryabhattai TaxID=412384 RepID=UPI003531EA17
MNFSEAEKNYYQSEKEKFDLIKRHEEELRLAKLNVIKSLRKMQSLCDHDFKGFIPPKVCKKCGVAK